jgi:hypothetical protein
MLHEADRRTSAIVDAIVAASGDALPGDRVTVPHSAVALLLERKTSLAELRRLRRQFLVRLQARAPDDVDALGPQFVEFVAAALRAAPG